MGNSAVDVTALVAGVVIALVITGALGHLEQPLFERCELFVEMTKTSRFGGTHPNLPVI